MHLGSLLPLSRSLSVKQFMAMPAIVLYYEIFLGFESLSLAPGVNSSIGVVVLHFYSHNFGIKVGFVFSQSSVLLFCMVFCLFMKLFGHFS